MTKFEIVGGGPGIGVVSGVPMGKPRPLVAIQLRRVSKIFQTRTSLPKRSRCRDVLPSNRVSQIVRPT